MASIPAGSGDSPGETWFGHPRQLARLFTTEAMERFGYYGMRALLTLHLADHFLFSDSTTTSLYGRLHGTGLPDALGRRPDRRPLSRLEAVGEVRRDRHVDGLFDPVLRRRCGQAVRDGRRRPLRGAVDKTPTGKQQFVIDKGQRLAIKGRDDGSVDLIGADGVPTHSIPKGGFVAGGDRSPFYTMLMLIGLSR